MNYYLGFRPQAEALKSGSGGRAGLAVSRVPCASEGRDGVRVSSPVRGRRRRRSAQSRPCCCPDGLAGLVGVGLRGGGGSSACAGLQGGVPAAWPGSAEASFPPGSGFSLSMHPTGRETTVTGQSRRASAPPDMLCVRRVGTPAVRRCRARIQMGAGDGIGRVNLNWVYSGLFPSVSLAPAVTAEGLPRHSPSSPVCLCLTMTCLQFFHDTTFKRAA